MDKLNIAYNQLVASIVSEVYSEAYSKIQSLGDFGFHTDVTITRQEALDALRVAKIETLAKLYKS